MMVLSLIEHMFASEKPIVMDYASQCKVQSMDPRHGTGTLNPGYCS
jgi:hypothetical protein